MPEAPEALSPLLKIDLLPNLFAWPEALFSLLRKMRPGGLRFHGGIQSVIRGALRRAQRGALELFPCRGMCYKRPAVEHAVKPGAAPVRREPAGSASPQLAAEAKESAIAPQEDASRYCPVCSHRLESRRCKLICAVCGYYMSCADYY
jgi:hypothetical protein